MPYPPVNASLPYYCQFDTWYWDFLPLCRCLCRCYNHMRPCICDMYSSVRVFSFLSDVLSSNPLCWAMMFLKMRMLAAWPPARFTAWGPTCGYFIYLLTVSTCVNVIYSAIHEVLACRCYLKITQWWLKVRWLSSLRFFNSYHTSYLHNNNLTAPAVLHIVPSGRGGILLSTAVIL